MINFHFINKIAKFIFLKWNYLCIYNITYFNFLKWNYLCIYNITYFNFVKWNYLCIYNKHIFFVQCYSSITQILTIMKLYLWYIYICQYVSYKYIMYIIESNVINKISHFYTFIYYYSMYYITQKMKHILKKNYARDAPYCSALRVRNKYNSILCMSEFIINISYEHCIFFLAVSFGWFLIQLYFFIIKQFFKFEYIKLKIIYVIFSIVFL